MKKYFILLIIFFLSKSIFSQSHGNLTAYLYELQQLSSNDDIEHIDTSLDYKITIPSWWKIKETPRTNLFGGTFPALNGIENALLFKSWSKKDFTSFDDFEKWVVKSYSLGDVPSWSDGSHKLLLVKKIDTFDKIGNSYFIQLMRNGSIYECCFIVVETPNTYLWIDFTATKDTYQINLKKLSELLKSFEIINQNKI